MNTAPTRTGNSRRLDPRTVIAGIALVSAAVLVPWTLYLGSSLPSVQAIESWSSTWVGFDVLLLAALAVAGVLGLRHSRWFPPATAAATTLLCADAWFDVMTSSGTELWVAVAMAALVELPLAAVLFTGVGRSPAPAPAPTAITA